MTVVVPAGLPLLDAARWVGGSCWLELRVHQLFTEVLADDGSDASRGDGDRAGAPLADEVRVALWTVRANRAEVAEAWHRRLPELREFPRETFVVEPVDDGSDPGEGPAVDAANGIGQVVRWLSLLDQRYSAHAEVAVGPADGPVAATLARARDLVAHDLGVLDVGP